MAAGEWGSLGRRAQLSYCAGWGLVLLGSAFIGSLALPSSSLGQSPNAITAGICPSPHPAPALNGKHAHHSMSQPGSTPFVLFVFPCTIRLAWGASPSPPTKFPSPGKLTGDSLILPSGRMRLNASPKFPYMPSRLPLHGSISLTDHKLPKGRGWHPVIFVHSA